VKLQFLEVKLGKLISINQSNESIISRPVDISAPLSRCYWMLNVRRTRLSTIGDRAFPVAAARTRNSLSNMLRLHPQCVYVSQSVNQSTFIQCQDIVS